MTEENKRIYDVIHKFLSERGYLAHEKESDQSSLALDSLDYLSLILHLEDTLNLVIDYNTFFADSLPEVETLNSLCTRISSASTV